jgi:hypothetical protein
VWARTCGRFRAQLLPKQTHTERDIHAIWMGCYAKRCCAMRSRQCTYGTLELNDVGVGKAVMSPDDVIVALCGGQHS